MKTIQNYVFPGDLRCSYFGIFLSENKSITPQHDCAKWSSDLFLMDFCFFHLDLCDTALAAPVMSKPESVLFHRIVISRSHS